MEELKNHNMDISHLIKQINLLDIGEEKELKDIYGIDRWKDVKSHTQVGKIFKAFVANNEIENLILISKQGDNHLIYKKIERINNAK